MKTFRITSASIRYLLLDTFLSLAETFMDTRAIRGRRIINVSFDTTRRRYDEKVYEIFKAAKGNTTVPNRNRPNKEHLLPDQETLHATNVPCVFSLVGYVPFRSGQPNTKARGSQLSVDRKISRSRVIKRIRMYSPPRMTKRN